MEGIMRTLVVLGAIVVGGCQAAVGIARQQAFHQTTLSTNENPLTSEIDPATGTVFITYVAGNIYAYRLLLPNLPPYQPGGANPYIGGTLQRTLTLVNVGTVLVYGNSGGWIVQTRPTYLAGLVSFVNPSLNTNQGGAGVQIAMAVPNTNKIIIGKTGCGIVFNTDPGNVGPYVTGTADVNHLSISLDSGSNFFFLGGIYDNIYVVSVSTAASIAQFTTGSYFAQKTASTGLLCQSATGKLFDLAYGTTVTSIRRLSYTAAPVISEDAVALILSILYFDSTAVPAMAWLGATQYFYVGGSLGVMFFKGNSMELTEIPLNYPLLFCNTKAQQYSFSKIPYEVAGTSSPFFWLTVATFDPDRPANLDFRKISINITDCPIEGCAICGTGASTFTVCFECNPVYDVPYVSLPSDFAGGVDTCIPEYLTPEGMGKDPAYSFKRLGNCTTPGCLGCFKDITICTDTLKIDLQVESKIYNKSSTTAGVIFNQEIYSPIQLSMLAFTLYDEVEETFYPCTPSTCQVNVLPRGITVRLSFEGLIVLQGTLYINKAKQYMKSPFKSKLGGPTYDSWPLLVRNVTFASSDSKGNLGLTAGFARASSSFASAGRSAMSFFGVLISP